MNKMSYPFYKSNQLQFSGRSKYKHPKGYFNIENGEIDLRIKRLEI